MKTNILRKFTVLAIAAIAALVISSLTNVEAQSTSTIKPTTSSPTSTSSQVKGKIESVDLSGKTFTVGKKKNSSVLTFNDSTMFRLGKKKQGNASDLVVGGHATVTYSTGTDGKLLATIVTIKKSKVKSTSTPQTTGA